MPDAVFTWDLNASHESYEVTYRDITNSGSIINVTPPLIMPPNHSTTIQNLLSNTEYEFCVRANCRPDGVTQWICKRETTPNVPTFRVNLRVYNPLGDGMPTNDFMGGGLSNFPDTVSTASVLSANPATNTIIPTTTRIFNLSNFTNNIFKISLNCNNSQCQAVYIKKNGTLIHQIAFNTSAGLPVYNVNLTTANVPSTIVINDVFDILFVTNNQASTSGDPYIPSAYIGTCGG